MIKNISLLKLRAIPLYVVYKGQVNLQDLGSFLNVGLTALNLLDSFFLPPLFILPLYSWQGRSTKFWAPHIGSLLIYIYYLFSKSVFVLSFLEPLGERHDSVCWHSTRTLFVFIRTSIKQNCELPVVHRIH